MNINTKGIFDEVRDIIDGHPAITNIDADVLLAKAVLLIREKIMVMDKEIEALKHGEAARQRT